MIPASRFDLPCIPDSSKFSKEDNVTEFKGECCSILRSGLRSLAIEVDLIDDFSVSERLDLCFSPLVVTTETLTPPLLRVFA